VAPEERVPVIYLTCGCDGERVAMRSIHRMTWQTRNNRDPSAPFPRAPTAVLRDAAGRTLSWAILRRGFVHFYGGGDGGDGCRTELSGDWHAELRDHADAAHLAIVNEDRVLWEIRRPARPPTIHGVRAAVVAAGDLDHPYARHYVPEARLLHVQWTDDSEGSYYEREVLWATPERPEGGWTGQAAVGEPRGEAVVALGGIPLGDVRVRVRLSDGFHVVESDPVVVRVPGSRAVSPVARRVRRRRR
jgi:hypothetical protein